MHAHVSFNAEASLAPSHSLVQKTRLHPFFFKQAATPFIQGRNLGANNNNNNTISPSPYLSYKRHLHRNQPTRARRPAVSSSGLAATTSGATANEAEVRFPAGSCLGPAEGGSRVGGRAGMAAAAAGAGAAQEKQFPPALLSFFIYNPRFGPREGEVSGAGLRAGVSRRPRRGRGRPARDGPGEPPGASERRPRPAHRRRSPAALPSSSSMNEAALCQVCARVRGYGGDQTEQSGSVSGPGSASVY